MILILMRSCRITIKGPTKQYSTQSDKGADRIGFLGGDMDLTSAKERYKGYMKALEDNSLTPDESIVLFGDYHSRSGYVLMRDPYGTCQSPSAYIYFQLFHAPGSRPLSA